MGSLGAHELLKVLTHLPVHRVRARVHYPGRAVAPVPHLVPRRAERVSRAYESVQRQVASIPR